MIQKYYGWLPKRERHVGSQWNFEAFLVISGKCQSWNRFWNTLRTFTYFGPLEQDFVSGKAGPFPLTVSCPLFSLKIYVIQMIPWTELKTRRKFFALISWLISVWAHIYSVSRWHMEILRGTQKFRILTRKRNIFTKR